MSDHAPHPKLKKQAMKRGSVNAGRKRSSVSQVENVVSKFMEAEAGGGFLLPEIDKNVLKEEIKGEKKMERRLVLKNCNAFCNKKVVY